MPATTIDPADICAAEPSTYGRDYQVTLIDPAGEITVPIADCLSLAAAQHLAAQVADIVLAWRAET